MSGSWTEMRLGDAVEVGHGFAFKGEHFSDEGELIVLTPGNFIESGGFKDKSGKEKYYLGEFPATYLLSRGDVVVAMTEQSHGLLGSTATVPSDGKYLHNQRIGLVTVSDQSRLALRFVYHALNGPVARNQIQATATGSKVRHTAPDRIKLVVLPVPAVDEQKRIALLLDTFDDLIENNRRRIEILEEMARLLYREWFVHFRFPGHEDVDLVDSELGPIPAGWTLSRLADVAKVNASSVRKGDDLGEILYLDISSVGPRTMASPDPMLFSEAPGRARRCVQHGDVIWSTVRPNRRSHVMIQDPAMNLICSTGFAVLSANSVPPSYLLELCSTDDFVSHLESLATGAAYPAVRPADFEVYRFVKPPNHLLQCWDEQARPMNDLVGNLTRQNAVLREARDLLLPRLVSGELDVSELDLGGLVA